MLAEALLETYLPCWGDGVGCYVKLPVPVCEQAQSQSSNTYWGRTGGGRGGEGGGEVGTCSC